MNLNVTVNGRAHTIDVDPSLLLSNCSCARPSISPARTSAATLAVRRLRRPCRRRLDEELHDAVGGLRGRRGGHHHRRPGRHRRARKGALHPMQEAFHTNHGLQCGFCTPGMVMSAVDFAGAIRRPTESDVRHWLEGNICRCTGLPEHRRGRAAGAAAMHAGGGALTMMDGNRASARRSCARKTGASSPGKGNYVADIKRPDMTYGRASRSPSCARDPQVGSIRPRHRSMPGVVGDLHRRRSRRRQCRRHRPAAGALPMATARR